MSRAVIIGLFVLGGLIFLVLAVLSRRPGSVVPTFGACVEAVVGWEVRRIPVGRIAVYAFWWWVGWHFLAR
ncbi:DUF6186 family protein [Luedemannella flava]|uniref:DUF6186 family protein n=1 Tax=Luedemannella flava TaxID=349316 RepID=UPI0031CE1834